MKRLLTAGLSATFAMLCCGVVLAQSFVGQIGWNAGPGQTGNASSVRVTLYQRLSNGTRNTLVAATNTPDGTHAFAESPNIPGNFEAPYSFVTSNATAPVYFEVWLNGNTAINATGSIWVDRATQIADGYTAAAGTNIGTLSFSGSNVKSAVQSIVASGIDMAQLSPTLRSLMLHSYLVTTGTTSPASADEWFSGGLYNNSVFYQSSTAGLFAWNNGSGWTISSAVGTNGGSYWTTAAGGSVNSTYTPNGAATGAPVVVSHGNAILSGFQPSLILSNGYVATAPLRKNQGYNNFTFYAAQVANSNAPATGMSWTATVSLDGAGFVATTGGAVTEVGFGFYRVNLSAADLNANNVALRIVAPGAQTQNFTFVLNQ